MNNTFSIEESFRSAWKIFAQRPWFFMLVLAAVLVLVGVTSSVLQPAEGGNIIFWIIGMVINIFVDMGLVAFALAAQRNVQTLGWKDLWIPSRFWKYLAANIAVAVIVAIGILLLIIPGIIAALALMFVKYLVIDKDLGPIEAIKESWNISKKHLLKLFLLLLVLVALNIAGAVALLVGLLVTVPLTMLVVAHVYRTLEHKAHEVSATA